MKRTLIVMLALTACLFTSNAFAGLLNSYTDDARGYLTLSGGASKVMGIDLSDPSGATRLSFLPGYNATIATGLAWDVGRLEFSGQYTYSALDQVQNGSWSDTTGKMKAFDLLMSVFYDFNKDGLLSPYFGGGVGAAWFDLDTPAVTGGSAFSFAYQGGAGVTINTSDNFGIDLGYKVQNTNSVNFGATKADNILIQNINVGLRWLF